MSSRYRRIGSVVWDVHRLDRDFKRLFSLLSQARLDAFYGDATIIVKFGDRSVTVSDGKGSRRVIAVPSLSAIDYDTTLGDNMIVYTWRGTAKHNRREHGGEILRPARTGQGGIIRRIFVYQIAARIQGLCGAQ